MSSASLPTAFLNDMKPGKEAENVFFFLYCKRQEITHWGQLNTKNRTAAEFQLEEELPGGSQAPHTHPCLPNPGQSSSPSAPTAHTLGFCSSSLKIWALFLCFSSFLQATHLLFDYYWGAITFLLPHLPHGPEATWHHVKEKLLGLASSIQGHNVLMQLKWNRALFSLPARLCVCVYWGVYL